MAENWYLFIPAEIYYNWDAAYITGDGNGGYSNCYSAWQWETGFPGWHTQTWCGWGLVGNHTVMRVVGWLAAGVGLGAASLLDPLGMLVAIIVLGVLIGSGGGPTPLDSC